MKWSKYIRVSDKGMEKLIAIKGKTASPDRYEIGKGFIIEVRKDIAYLFTNTTEMAFDVMRLYLLSKKLMRIDLFCKGVHVGAYTFYHRSGLIE